LNGKYNEKVGNPNSEKVFMADEYISDMKKATPTDSPSVIKEYFHVF
jgi:hypothetical protein